MAFGALATSACPAHASAGVLDALSQQVIVAADAPRKV
jgi:hypothetical protein